MKIQDFVFLVAFIFLIFRKDSRWATVVGIVCLILSIPLFNFWVFFTAERLTWYAASFFLLSIILHLLPKQKNRA